MEIQNSSKKASISQCMIVKNEEKHIRQALSWGKGIVAEQIVVDTGSTDRTVEIAEEMGAKVYSFPWVGDFSAAKNFAISKARGEWIAFLDADEYFSQEDAGKLFSCIEKLKDTAYEGILTGWIHLNNAGDIMAIEAQIRLFRNQPNLRYRRRIHEQLKVDGMRAPRLWDGTKMLSIFHTGYGEAESLAKRESRRNLNLIMAELEERPDDYEMLGYLGNEYESLQEWDEAEKAYRKAVALIPKELHGVYDISTSGLLFRLLELLAVRQETAQDEQEPPLSPMTLGENSPKDQRQKVLSRQKSRAEELMAVYRFAVTAWPEEGDFDFILGRYFANRGDYQLGEEHIRRSLGILERYGTALRSGVVSSKIMEIYELLAMCCFNNGNLSECVRLTTALLKENPYLKNAALLMVSAFRKDMERLGKGEKGAREVAAMLGGAFYDFRDRKALLFVLRVAMWAGYEELIQVIRGQLTEEERKQVDEFFAES